MQAIVPRLRDHSLLHGKQKKAQKNIARHMCPLDLLLFISQFACINAYHKDRQSLQGNSKYVDRFTKMAERFYGDPPYDAKQRSPGQGMGFTMNKRIQGGKQQIENDNSQDIPIPCTTPSVPRDEKQIAQKCSNGEVFDQDIINQICCSTDDKVVREDSLYPLLFKRPIRQAVLYV